jgi:hypothetical protein
VTIRAKLIAAIALTAIGPVVTIGDALAAFGALGDRFDAAAQDRHVAEARAGFDDARDRARRELVAVAIGAAIVIVLLLITVQDVVRLALERREERA